MWALQMGPDRAPIFLPVIEQVYDVGMSLPKWISFLVLCHHEEKKLSLSLTDTRTSVYGDGVGRSCSEGGEAAADARELLLVFAATSSSFSVLVLRECLWGRRQQCRPGPLQEPRRHGSARRVAHGSLLFL